MCMNVSGMNESCEIKALDEAEKRICELNASSEEEASCALPKHPGVVILVMVYDESHLNVPAVTEMFIMTALDSYSLIVTYTAKSDGHSHLKS